MDIEADVEKIVGIELNGNWVGSVPSSWPEISAKTTAEYRRVAAELHQWFPPDKRSLCFFPQENLDVAVENAVNDLKVHGLHVFPISLADEKVDLIATYLRSRPHRIKSSGRRLSNISGARINTRGGQTRWIDDLQDVIESPYVLDIAGDGLILSTVRSYLGVEPVLMQANSWWTIKGSKFHQNPDQDAQLFHQDNEFLSFLKVFIYLTDVSAANGPHRIVTGSHRDFEQKLGANHPPSTRLSQEELSRIYDDSRIRSIEGKKGSIFIVDTTCLHAGSPVTEGFRGVLQLEYASSPYFSQVQPFSRANLEGASLFEVFGTDSRLLINFRDNDYDLWLKAKDPRFTQALKKRFAPYRNFVVRFLKNRLDRLRPQDTD